METEKFKQETRAYLLKFFSEEDVQKLYENNRSMLFGAMARFWEEIVAAAETRWGPSEGVCFRPSPVYGGYELRICSPPFMEGRIKPLEEEEKTRSTRELEETYKRKPGMQFLEVDHAWQLGAQLTFNGCSFFGYVLRAAILEKPDVFPVTKIGLVYQRGKGVFRFTHTFPGLALGQNKMEGPWDNEVDYRDRRDLRKFCAQFFKQIAKGDFQNTRWLTEADNADRAYAQELHDSGDLSKQNLIQRVVVGINKAAGKDVSPLVKISQDIWSCEVLDSTIRKLQIYILSDKEQEELRIKILEFQHFLFVGSAINLEQLGVLISQCDFSYIAQKIKAGETTPEWGCF